jgi:hypothetical protein
MRLIGASERGMQMMVQRALSRKAFGKLIAEHGSFRSDVAKVIFFIYFFVRYHFLQGKQYLPSHLKKLRNRSFNLKKGTTIRPLQY